MAKKPPTLHWHGDVVFSTSSDLDAVLPLFMAAGVAVCSIDIDPRSDTVDMRAKVWARTLAFAARGPRDFTVWIRTAGIYTPYADVSAIEHEMPIGAPRTLRVVVSNIGVAGSAAVYVPLSLDGDDANNVFVILDPEEKSWRSRFVHQNPKETEVDAAYVFGGINYATRYTERAAAESFAGRVRKEYNVVVTSLADARVTDASSRRNSPR